MNAQEHKEAIEAAVQAAVSDGYHVDVVNRCEGCCDDFRVTLYGGDESVGLDIDV